MSGSPSYLVFVYSARREKEEAEVGSKVKVDGVVKTEVSPVFLFFMTCLHRLLPEL